MVRRVSDTVEPWEHGRALDDPMSRRAVGLYILRALGLLAVALALVLGGDVFLTDSGDTRAGVPDVVPGAFFVAALLAGLVGILSLFNVVRIVWVLARQPWRRVESVFEEIGRVVTPNGQPVLCLVQGDNRWTLTLAALKWRWHRFDRSELLLAARPRRGGVVATEDRRAIVWAGRSPFTWLFRRHVSRADSNA
jgi:hypothetical protein